MRMSYKEKGEVKKSQNHYLLKASQSLPANDQLGGKVATDSSLDLPYNFWWMHVLKKIFRAIMTSCPVLGH